MVMRSNKITVVIEYTEEQEQPRFHENMELLDGKVIAVQFGDAIQTIDELEDCIIELQEAVEESQ
jgi:hypothetical protein